MKTERATGVRVVQGLPEEAWRAALRDLPGATVFHTPEMAEVFGRTTGHRPETWAALRDDRVLALLTPVRIALRAGLARYLTTRAVAYGGILRADGPEGDEGLDAILGAYGRGVDHAVLFTEVRHLRDPSASRALSRNKITVNARCAAGGHAGKSARSTCGL